MILEATAAATGGICISCKKQLEREAKLEAASQLSPADEEEDRIRDAIQDRIEGVIGTGCFVKFAAYQLDSSDMPIDNLDEVAAFDSVQFVQDHDPFWGAGQPYQSKTIENPTWMDVAVIANEMISVTGDKQHCFLEGFTWLRNEDGIAILDLDMGS